MARTAAFNDHREDLRYVTTLIFLILFPLAENSHACLRDITI